MTRSSAFARPEPPLSDPAPELSTTSASSPPSSRAAEDYITLTVRMVAPPERFETASIKAIQQYEKRREFTIGRVSQNLLGCEANSLGGT